MRRDSTVVGAAAVLFALLTFIGMVVANPPGGDYKQSDITSFLADGHRAAVVAGTYVMLAGAVCLVYLLTTLRGRTAGRWGALFAGTSGVAAAAWTIGAVVVGVVPLGLSNGAVVAPEPHTVYMLTQVGFATLFGAGGILLGVSLLAFAFGAALPTWLRVATWIAGIAGLLSPMFFPFLLLLVWGIVFGVWTLASKRAVDVPEAVTV